MIINIFIPIYTYNKDVHRYNLTEKIFKHYKNICNIFKDKVLFQFVILGSELDISKELTLKYFKEDEYYEFDQNDPKYNGDLKIMFKEKIIRGVLISIEKKPYDIFLSIGSNDYICIDFFEEIINFYNPLKPQIYGIDNYKNGKNAVYYCHYNGINDINNNKENSLTKNTRKNILGYWWNGISSYCNREVYNYCGGVFGVNYKYFSLYPEILENLDYDEGKMEKLLLEKNDVEKFNSKEMFYINIKTPNKTEITTYKKLLMYNITNIINFEDLTEYTKLNFLKEFNNFLNL